MTLFPPLAGSSVNVAKAQEGPLSSGSSSRDCGNLLDPVPWVAIIENQSLVSIERFMDFIPRSIYTVSRLTAEIKDILETNFEEIWVEGEVSNLGEIEVADRFSPRGLCEAGESVEQGGATTRADVQRASLEQAVAIAGGEVVAEVAGAQVIAAGPGDASEIGVLIE